MLLTPSEAQMGKMDHVLLTEDGDRLESSLLLGQQWESSHTWDCSRKSWD